MADRIVTMIYRFMLYELMGEPAGENTKVYDKARTHYFPLSLVEEGAKTGTTIETGKEDYSISNGPPQPYFQEFKIYDDCIIRGTDQIDTEHYKRVFEEFKKWVLQNTQQDDRKNKQWVYVALKYTTDSYYEKNQENYPHDFSGYTNLNTTK